MIIFRCCADFSLIENTTPSSVHDILETFGDLFKPETAHPIFSAPPFGDEDERQITEGNEKSITERFTAAGGIVSRYYPGKVLIRKGQ